jgi:hypothetical protein
MASDRSSRLKKLTLRVPVEDALRGAMQGPPPDQKPKKKAAKKRKRKQ